MQQILTTKRKHLHQLQEARTNRLKQFGSQVPALLDAIDEAYRKGQFTRKPVGPLGRGRLGLVRGGALPCWVWVTSARQKGLRTHAVVPRLWGHMAGV